MSWVQIPLGSLFSPHSMFSFPSAIVSRAQLISFCCCFFFFSPSKCNFKGEKVVFLHFIFFHQECTHLTCSSFCKQKPRSLTTTISQDSGHLPSSLVVVFLFMQGKDVKNRSLPPPSQLTPCNRDTAWAHSSTYFAASPSRRRCGPGPGCCSSSGGDGTDTGTHGSTPWLPPRRTA